MFLTTTGLQSHTNMKKASKCPSTISFTSIFVKPLQLCHRAIKSSIYYDIDQQMPYGAVCPHGILVILD